MDLSEFFFFSVGPEQRKNRLNFGKYLDSFQCIFNDFGFLINIALKVRSGSSGFFLWPGPGQRKK